MTDISTHRVIFDQGPLDGPTVFTKPHRVIRADHPADVYDALAALTEAQANGQWLAGYASYELGYLFTPKLRDLMPAQRDTPLLHFGVFEEPGPDLSRAPTDTATLSAPHPAWGLAEYEAAYARVKDYIAAGDIYQANLTFPMSAQRTGSPEALYAALRARQSVPHGAFVDLGGPVLLSRSPELFFRIDADRTLHARPMKGTAPRGDTPQEDRALSDWLQASVKNRAENLMIVDLLRNDMSRISEIGSVKVPKLFDVETYATVHQMTSTITAKLRCDVTLTDIFEALFPCGSITGAPKIRAMQIIEELETTPRGAYCGAIGWIAPDGAMSFNVPIRTLTCFDDGSVRLNVGGGVVHDSQGDDEYGEALLKAAYADLH
mgnify:CR=1 FL=1